MSALTVLVRRCVAGHLTDSPLDQRGYVDCAQCGFASRPSATYRLLPAQRSAEDQ